MLNEILWVGWRVIVFLGAAAFALVFIGTALMLAMVMMRKFTDWQYQRDMAKEKEQKKP